MSTPPTDSDSLQMDAAADCWQPPEDCAGNGLPSNAGDSVRLARSVRLRRSILRVRAHHLVK